MQKCKCAISSFEHFLVIERAFALFTIAAADIARDLPRERDLCSRDYKLPMPLIFGEENRKER